MRVEAGGLVSLKSRLHYLDTIAVLAAVSFGLALLYFSPFWAIAIAGGLAATVYFSNRIHQLIYFLIFYLPLEEFLLKWVDYSIYPVLRFGIELVIYLVLAKVVFSKVARNEKVLSSPIDLPLILLIALGLLSTFVNHIPLSAGLLGLRPFLRYAALFYLILNSNLSPAELPRFFKIVSGILLLEVAISLGQFIVGEPANLFLKPKDLLVGQTIIDARERWQDLFAGQKIFGTLGRYNLLGAFLALALLLLAAFRLEKGGFDFKYKILAVSSVIVLLLTYSRLSWLGFLAGLLTLILVKKKGRMLLAFGTAGLVLFMALSSVSTSLYQSEVRGGLKDRIIGPFTADYWHMSSSSQRVFATTQVLSNTPLPNLFLGFGPGTLGSLVTNLQEGVSQLHQLGDPKKLLVIGDVGWITLLGQMGIFGFGLMVWILWSIYRNSLRVYRHAQDFWVKTFSLSLLALTTGMVVMNFFSLAFEARVSSAYFWIMAGVTLKEYDQ